MREFQVNKFITLKLISEQTYIYVGGEEFRQCKSLVLSIDLEDTHKYDRIDSIDEAADLLDKTLEKAKLPTIKITPEVEFWGHCSNLQAWAENSYDTRLLHSNISFPLLKGLTEVGDSLAKRIFKEEIAKRFNCGFLPVIIYLIENNYLSIFNQEELDCLIEGFDFNGIKNVHKFLRLIKNNANRTNLFLEKKLHGFIWRKHFYRNHHQAKYRGIPQTLMNIKRYFRVEIFFYNFSMKLLDVIWHLIKDTTDNIVAGMCASIAALYYYKDSISVASICRFLDINVSDIHNHIYIRIFRKFNASDSFSFLQSFDSLKEIIERLDEKLI